MPFPFPRLVTCALLLLSIGLSTAALPLAPSADPAINEPYQDPDYDRWVERFERPGREVYDRRQAILMAVDPQPGMDIADIGAGTGLFTRLFAEAVGPTGRVFAVDIAEGFVRNIERTAAERGLENVVGVVNSQVDTGLSPESVDLVFLCDTYHHFERPAAMLGSIHRALRPGGRLILVDYERIPGESPAWVMGHVRAGKEVFAEEIRQAGFVFDGEADLLREHYLLRFHKPAR
ncbi:class I SAM-dependent methyltransferase [Thiococcus pfennigii]|jgi:predicted methyltransferase|uniref:class I SAM-dependent methyltransferase n=1 Tax=Thiococcus pfennigii TaxID=1057 RepID=UPI00190606F6|nr:methyltransferase domain-containing protein [Thiococcus pfennigii]MBK1700026.1 hypothetical protein [Thiococcus pfennigii]